MTMLRKFICSLFVIFLTIPAYGITIGSDTTPSRQANAEFTGVDNKMLGFAAFENGFSFYDPLTTCSFDSVFPVSGLVDMKGGSVYLSKNLIFDEGTTLTCFGSIYGNNFSVIFPESVTTVTAFVAGGTDDSLSELHILSRSAQPHEVDCFYDDNYVVAVEFKSTSEVLSFDGSTLTPIDDNTYSTKIYSYCVRAHPSAYYYVIGSTYRSTEDEIRVMEFAADTISLNASLDSLYSIVAVDWSTSGSYIAAGSDDGVEVYSFSPGSLALVNGISFGTDEETSQRAIIWDRIENFIAVGTTSGTAPKLRIYYFNGTTVTAKTSETIGTDNVLAVDWSHTGSFIAIGTDGASNNVRVYEYNSSLDSLTLRKQISVGGAVNAVRWNSDTTRLLVGKFNDLTGTECHSYGFNTVDYALSLKFELEKTADINSIRWSGDDSYVFYVDSAKNVGVCSYVKGVEGHECDYSILDNVSIILNNDLSWLMSTTVQGECTIDAGNNKIMFDGMGVLTVTTNAQLTIENAELTGLTSMNFKCADDTGSIVFKNSTIHLDNDFDFANGSLLFQGDCVICGINQLNYTSDVMSTIDSGATLLLTATFRYAPTTANRDLIYMTDDTSCLYLDGCTLKSTATGMRITKGKVFLDNDVTFSCEGTKASESICFGDGTVENDADVTLLSGAFLTVYGGWHYDDT